MERYETRLFKAQDLAGEHAGEFVDVKDDIDLDEWMQGGAEEGYALKNMQPVVYAGSLYVLATIELVNVEDYDNPA